MVSRADLHVHSKYSDRPSEWILRRIGAPECYTEPQTVYEVAKRRGMQFVTISDHNCIQGALEIAHHADAFISSEITTYFPEDGCKIHVLVWNICEAQFQDIQRLRENIYELRDYLVDKEIVHSCAHPLYMINDRLTVNHFEKLLLMFDVFETLNGGRNRRNNDLAMAVLKSLTQDQLDDMANRQGIVPRGEKPWVKGMSGGSDDHSGAFVAAGYTECPDSSTFKEFLEHIVQGRSISGGFDGTPLSFAHSLYSIGYQYYLERFFPSSRGGRDSILKTLGEVLGEEHTRLGLKEKVAYYGRKLARRNTKPAELELKHLLASELGLFSNDWRKDDFVSDPQRFGDLNRRTFELACKISNTLLFQFFKKFVKKLRKGSVFGSIEAVSALGPVLFGVSPYLFSFAYQNRDRQFLSDISDRFFGMRPELTRKPKKAWFTDTLEVVNGVTTLLYMMCHQAQRHEHDLTLISFSESAPEYPGRVKTFKPVGKFTLPEYDTMTLAFPPLLDVLEFCEREQFSELIISTPGLAGLAGLVAAKILGIRMVGIYHTDLPRCVRYYTEDEALERATWKYLHWFYEQMDLIFVPSRDYRQQLIQKDFTPQKLRLFPHGTDIERFHPRNRKPDFWCQYGHFGSPKIIYVGRVAKEKDLDILSDVYSQLARRRPECTLAVDW